MYELLKTEWRDDKVKAPLTRMRRDGWVPGVLFGKGFESTSFMVRKNDLTKFLHHSGKVFEVEVKGYGKHLVSLDNVQWDHMGDFIKHISFHKISANEKTIVKLPIHFVGEAVGIKEGGVVQQVMQEVEVKGLPKDMPEFLEFDISSLGFHSHFTLHDVTLPKGLEFHHDMEDTLVSCHPPKKVVETVEETVAQPELVGKETVVEDEVKEAA
ncbi:50S ribosomal protein L25 [Halobacteriovorax sp. GB3]|uniref:50S ribosomal protein L25 n=1 Tax=Halobacteriovorax sp. GB3 TaxID=2719615 RepID=UPI002361CC97|nr:50S ribosomal protein L25 [Halobacteriovorax sp. GB3]MDD0852069.1 50S ribosomal protein L25 [Halobacteriovorax sp. GB3]